MGAQAGQKVYTITREVYSNNPGIVSTHLSAHSASTRERVQQALDVGYEVTIHEAPITQDGWTGAGFTMIDPSTGAGGYLIEGGANGGELDGDFGQRYLAWVNNHMITNEYVLAAVMVLLPFATVSKALFGFGMVLGTPNPYTTILRGLAVTFGWAAISSFAGMVGPVLGVPVLLAIIFIGFFNLASLIAGLFYAYRRESLGTSVAWADIFPGLDMRRHHAVLLAAETREMAWRS